MLDANRALIPPAENREMFDSISRRYDLLNRIISLGLDRPWRRRAVDLLQVAAGGRYLDVGCGTGDICLEIVRRLPPGQVAVLGIDYAGAMLGEGEKKRRAAGAPGEAIHLMRGDALALPFGDGTVDGLVNGFVFRNLSDRRRALAEWFRVLRPGGRCVVLEVATPDSVLPRLVHRAVTGLLVPLAGAVLSKHQAYVYLLESIRAFPAAAIVLAMFREAGFEARSSLPMTLGAVRLYYGRKPLGRA